MIKGEVKGIFLLDTPLLRTVNNTFPSNIFPSFLVKPILPSFKD